MKKITWVDKHIEITPPKSTKKITGTRFGSILEVNPWSTPLEMWCAITKTYEKPFEDTKYTLAGKAIEPKQAEYISNSYGFDLKSPSDVYGENYFNTTHGDFFPSDPIFGGMWDYLAVDENGEIEAVLEMKTTKRVEDWQNDIPEYYALQAALYAYLLGVDNVIMVASFLKDKDYEHPEKFEPSIENTITRPFKVSNKYPNFEELVGRATKWWNEYVNNGVSPDYDEKRDADILKVLRTNSISPETDIQKLVAEGEQLKIELDAAKSETEEKEKRLKTINGLIKDYAAENLRLGDKTVELVGSHYKWVLTKTDREKVVVDEDALKDDALWDKYTKIVNESSMRLTVKEI